MQLKSAGIAGRITGFQCLPTSHPRLSYEEITWGRSPWAGCRHATRGPCLSRLRDKQGARPKLLFSHSTSCASPLGILFSTFWRFVKHMLWRSPNFFSQQEKNYYLYCKMPHENVRSFFITDSPGTTQQSAFLITSQCTFIGYKNGVMIHVPKPCLS